MTDRRRKARKVIRGASMALRIVHMAQTIHNAHSIQELASAGGEGARLFDAISADPELMEMFGDDPGALADLAQSDPAQFDALFAGDADLAEAWGDLGDPGWGGEGWEGEFWQGDPGEADWGGAGEIEAGDWGAADPGAHIGLPEAPAGWEPSAELPDLPDLPTDPGLPEAPLGWEPSAELPDLPDLPTDPGLPEAPPGWEWEPPPAPPGVPEPGIATGEIHGEIGAGAGAGPPDLLGERGEFIGLEAEQHVSGPLGDVHLRQRLGAEGWLDTHAGAEDGGFGAGIEAGGRSGAWVEAAYEKEVMGADLHGRGEAFSGIETTAGAGANVGSEGMEAEAGVNLFAGERAGIEGGIDSQVGSVAYGAEYRAGFGFEADMNLHLSWDRVGFRGDLGAAFGAGAGTTFDWSINPTGIYEGISGAVGDPLGALGSGAGSFVGGAGDVIGAAGSGLGKVTGWLP